MRSRLVNVYPKHKRLRTIQTDGRSRSFAMDRPLVGLCFLTNLPARADDVSGLNVTPSCLFRPPVRMIVDGSSIAQDARQAGNHRAALRSLRSAFRWCPPAGFSTASRIDIAIWANVNNEASHPRDPKQHARHRRGCALCRGPKG